jgi:hypothetical protein
MAEYWKEMKRGASWAIGFVAVLGTAFLLKSGARSVVKSAVQGVLRLRTASAEFSEQVQDIYAEAQAEYAAETDGHAHGQSLHMPDDSQPPQPRLEPELAGSRSR